MIAALQTDKRRTNQCQQRLISQRMVGLHHAVSYIGYRVAQKQKWTTMQTVNIA